MTTPAPEPSYDLDADIDLASIPPVEDLPYVEGTHDDDPDAGRDVAYGPGEEEEELAPYRAAAQPPAPGRVGE